jgi:integrase/recombinase XerD
MREAADELDEIDANVYLENGGTIENAQAIANHESPKTTKLCDHTSDHITLDEVERIAI